MRKQRAEKLKMLMDFGLEKEKLGRSKAAGGFWLIQEFASGWPTHFPLAEKGSIEELSAGERGREGTLQETEWLQEKLGGIFWVEEF